MAGTPEEQARELIDGQLTRAGWSVQAYRDMNLGAGRGLAVTEFPGANGPADYLLYVDRKAIGVLEAKPVGSTLRGVESQSQSYAEGLDEKLPAWGRPLPFHYESTGTVTQFTDRREPDARSREVFSVARPENLADLFSRGVPLRAGLQSMPPVDPAGLWPKQHTALEKVEASLAQGRPRSLLQMATGSGKTFTAANLAWRLIHHGNAKRVLFLVDRSNLGTQTLKEFQKFQPPGQGLPFPRLYNVDHPTSNTFDPANRVDITTIQRVYSVLTGNPAFDSDDEAHSLYEEADGPGAFHKPPRDVAYSDLLPPEHYDVILVDECHRSIYSVWGDVLGYFDAMIVGLTATPGKQTIGFFNRNLVMEYSHEEAVADRVNVPFDVYEIKTRISGTGSKVESGYHVGKRNRATWKERQEQLDEDLEYAAKDLDRDVMVEDQIRTVVRTFRDKLFTEIFPGRKEVPKTLVFAKSDRHADDIVKVIRDEFGKGNDFCQKITYRSGQRVRFSGKDGEADGETEAVAEPRAEYEEGVAGSDRPVYLSSRSSAEEILKGFRNSYNPRIAVTVDMIATGTDVKAVEIVFFLRTVKSENYFEQMKGRGVRVIHDDELAGVTPAGTDAAGRRLPPLTKDHFVIVDAVGVCHERRTQKGPLDRQPKKTLKQVFDHVKAGGTDPDAASALAAKLARLGLSMTRAQHDDIERLAKGRTLDDLVGGLVDALSPDKAYADAVAELTAQGEDREPTEAERDAAEEARVATALAPFYDPALRDRLLRLKDDRDQTVDRVSLDEVIAAGFTADGRERAQTKTQAFEAFIQEHRDELNALSVFFSDRTARRIHLDDLKLLAERIQAPPVNATTEELWAAYAALDATAPTAGGAGGQLTNLVTLLRRALDDGASLTPFPEVVRTRYDGWLAEQAEAGVTFSEEQRAWLNKVAEHVATSLAIEDEDFRYDWFGQQGSLGRAHRLFGPRFGEIVAEMNEALTG